MISRSQLFCVLLLSGLSAEIVFPYGGDLSGTGLAALVAAELIRFLLALPVLVYSLRGASFYSAIADKNSVAGVVAGITGALLLLLFAVRTLFYTAEFAQRTLLGGMSGAVLLILLAGFAVYSAAKGAEALSRAGVLILAAAVIVTLAVMLADIPHMRIRTVSGAEYDREFVRQVIERLLSGGEYLAFAAFMPYLKAREGKKGCGGLGFLFAAASAASAVLVCGFCITALGEFVSIAEYPFVAASQLADIAVFKRLDGFSGAIWSLAAGMRTAVMLFAAYAAVRHSLPEKTQKERKAA